MNILTRYIIAIGLFLIGSSAQLHANDSHVENIIVMGHDSFDTPISNSIHGTQVESNQSSSNSHLCVFDMEEEEDKLLHQKKRLNFFSFFLVYVLSQEAASSTHEEEIPVNFNKPHTQTAASRCALLQVFRI